MYDDIRLDVINNGVDRGRFSDIASLICNVRLGDVRGGEVENSNYPFGMSLLHSIDNGRT